MSQVSVASVFEVGNVDHREEGKTVCECLRHLGGQNTPEISPEIKATRGSNFLTGGRLRNFFLRNQPIFSEILEINRSDELELTGLIGYRHECFLVLRDREPIIKEV